VLTFHVFRDMRGEWRWNLRAANGRIVADSAEGYRSRSGARRAATRVSKAMPGSVVKLDA
jgi:uncharacterized protein YegP (UPF0339 family)